MYTIATLNNISQAGLSQFTPSYEIVEDIKKADGILVRSHDMCQMEFSDNLLAIARAGTGINNIPVDRCSQLGIAVFNTPGANANAVKELVLAGMLLAARNLPEALGWSSTLKELPQEEVSKTVEKGKGRFSGNELRGKVLGVIGLGSVGVLVANAAAALGMKVIGYDPFMTVSSAHELDNKVPIVYDMSQLLPHCDYITIHIPVMDETKDMINSKRFDEMKDGVVFLNFSRDKLVNDDNLIGALKSGKVRKYISDFPNGKLVNREGVLLIPHLGASTEEAEDNCATMAVQQLMDYFENGNIKNSVNFPECSLGNFIKTGTANTRICIMNKNVPTMLGTITGILAALNVNISNMNNRSKGNYAYTLLDVDSDIDEKSLKDSLKVEGIISVRVIK
ncbi:MAG: phosphoglycerate dehydrogenase [Anaerovoracaceae bacterium]|nr:phosphoglycerate dehydrogenase [Clostridiales bacterium]